MNEIDSENIVLNFDNWLGGLPPERRAGIDAHLKASGPFMEREKKRLASMAAVALDTGLDPALVNERWDTVRAGYAEKMAENSYSRLGDETGGEWMAAKDDEDAFYGQVSKALTKRKDYRGFSEYFSNDASKSALVMEEKDRFAEAARIKADAQAFPGMDQMDANDLASHWIDVRMRLEERAAPLRPEAREIYGMLSKGKEDRLSGESQAGIESAIDRLAMLAPEDRGIVVAMLKSQGGTDSTGAVIDKALVSAQRGLLGQLRGYSANTTRNEILMLKDRMKGELLIPDQLPMDNVFKVMLGKPSLGAAENLIYGNRPATEEEKAQLTAIADKAMTRADVAAQAIGILEGTIDPVKTENTTLGRFVQRTAIDVGTSIGAMAPIVLPYAGLIIAQGGYADQEYQKLREEGNDPATAQKAAQITGAVQAGIERAAFLFNFVPSSTIARVTASRAGSGLMGVRPGLETSTTFRVLSKMGTIQAAEYGEEIGQAAAPIFTGLLGEKLGWNMAEQSKFQGEISQFKEEGGFWRPEVFLAVAALSVFGGGYSGIKDSRQAQEALTTMLGDQTKLEAFGITPAKAAEIVAMPEAERKAAYVAEYPNRNVQTPGAIAAQQQVAAQVDAEIAQGQGELNQMQAAGVTITRSADGFNVVDDADGTAIPHATAEEAMTTVRAIVKARGMAREDTFLDALGEFTSMMQPGRTIQLSNKSGSLLQELEDATTQNKEQWVESIWDRADQERKKAGMEVLERDKNNPDSAAALDGMIVLGRSKTEAKGNVARSISLVLREGRTLDLVEEQAENDLREAVSAGNTSMETMRGIIERIEKSTGDKYLLDNTETGITEAWSSLVRLYTTGTRKGKGNKITAGARSEMASSIRSERQRLRSAETAGVTPSAFAKMREYLDYLKGVMGQVYRLQKARDAGLLDDLEAMIRESVGLKEQDALEAKVAEAVPTTYNLETGQGTSTIGYSINSRAQPADDSKRTMMPDGAELIGPTSYSIRAYHGTPYQVGRFSLDKIGTGEGAQAYGWGLYFAENQKVAEGYQNELGSGIEINGVKAVRLPIGGNNAATANDWAETALAGAHRPGETPEAIAGRAIKDIESSARSFRNQNAEAQTKLADAVLLIRQWSGTNSLTVKTGNLYTVDLLPNESDFLDWDKPLSEQPIIAQKLGIPLRDIEAEKALLRKSKELGVPIESFSEYAQQSAALDDLRRNLLGVEFYQEISNESTPEEASKQLAKAGIPGIKYLDGGSRDSGTGTSNFVIFDENLVKILEENGQPVSTEASTIGYSISTKRDADYMAAVESGDVATQQAMVDEAAKAAGLIKITRTQGDGAPSGYYERTEFPLKVLQQTEGAVRRINDGTFDELVAELDGVDPMDVEPLVTSPLYDDGTVDVYNGNHRVEVWKNYQVLPGDTAIPVWSFFDETDPITYDAQGNVIPLSQRFNPESANIGYSIAPARKTSLEMQMTRDEILDAIEKSKDWKDFYTTYQYLLDEYFGDDATAFQSILSITSQAASVKANVAIALRMYGYWKRGEEFDGKKRGEAESGALSGVLRNLERWRDDVALSGRKISNYQAANEGKEGATEKVVVDRHIANMLFGTKTPTGAQFTEAEKVLTEIAQSIGWEPRQVQAALWAASIRKSGTEPASYDQYLKTLRERGTIYERTGATPGAGGIFAEGVERPIRRPVARRGAGKTGTNGYSITTADRHAEYLKARESGNRNVAQRLVNQEAGVQSVDASIDRNGAHSPSGPEDGAPIWDATANGIYPDDIYTQAALRYYGTGDDAMDREAHSLIQSFRGNPNRTLKVYRALEKDGPKKIQPGEWVTTVRAYAKEHGMNALNGDYKIISETVHARDIFTSGDSWAEWGYHPQPAMPVAVNRGTDPTSLSLEQFQKLSQGSSYSITTAAGLENIKAQLDKVAIDPDVRFNMMQRASENLSKMVRDIGFRDDVAAAANDAGMAQMEQQQATALAGVVDRYSAEEQQRLRADEEALKELKAKHETALQDLSVKADIEAGGAQADGWTTDQKDALKVRQRLEQTTLQARQRAETLALETKQQKATDAAKAKERQEVNLLKQEQAAQRKANEQKTGEREQRATMLDYLAALDTILMPFPAEVRNKVGGFVSLAGLRTNAAMNKYLKDRVEKLNTVLENYMRKEYTIAMERLLKKAEPTKGKPGEKMAGKLGPDVQHLMDMVRTSLKWTAEEVNAHIAGLQTTIDGGTLTAEQEVLALREIELVQLAGDWTHADAAKRSAAVQAATETYEGGYLAWKAKLIAKREAREKIKPALITDTGKAGTQTERDERAKKDLGWMGKAKDFWLSLSSFEELTRYVFGEKSEAATEMVDRERAAAYQYEDATTAMGDLVQQHFNDLAGGHLKGEQLRFRLSQKTINTPSASLSELEAIQAILLWNQEDGKRHMIGTLDENNKPTGAWHYNQDWVDSVMAQMTPEGKATMAFIQRIYAEEWATLNPLYRERHGVNLPRHENYAPITVAPVQAKGGEMVDPVSGAAMTGSILTPGSLRTRSRRAIAEPEFRDALQTMLAHTKQMEHWKAYYDFAVDAQAILGNRDVGNAVQAAAGKEGKMVLRKWLDIFSQGGSRDAGAALAGNRLLSTMSGRAARMALVGRVGTLLIQSTQLAAASAEMPVGAYVSRLGRLLSGNLGWKNAIRSEFIQRRIQQAPPIVRQAMEGMTSDRPNVVRQAANYLGTLISGADGLFTSGTYAILLDYHMAQAAKLNITGPEAADYANRQAERITERVAQPTRMGTRSLFENTQTSPLAKLGWAFASEARQKIALAAWAARNAKADPARAARVAFLTWVVGGLMAQVIRNAWKDLKDDDDDTLFDDRNWNLKQMVASTLSGPLQGIPGLGSAFQSVISNTAGTYNQQGNLLDGFGKSVPALKGLISGESMEDAEPVEEIMKDVEAILTAAGMVNETAASATSLFHLVRDGSSVLDGLQDDAEELKAKAKAADRREAAERKKQRMEQGAQ